MGAAAKTLARELETFKTLLPNLTNEEGRFALIAEDKLIGVYDTYADALNAGYSARGLEPFLVKQIAAVDVVANFTRLLRPAWHISA